MNGNALNIKIYALLLNCMKGVFAYEIKNDRLSYSFDFQLDFHGGMPILLP